MKLSISSRGLCAMLATLIQKRQAYCIYFA
jgi:hypothetical protein